MPNPSNAAVSALTASSLSWDDYRLLVESVVDYAIFMLDTQGRVATWNLGAERIKGYRADEIVGQHFSKFYTAEDIQAQKPEQELATAAEQGRVEDEGWRLRKDGTRFWANVIITALRDKTGTLRGFGKVTRDLSARRAAEEQLRRAEERFHQLVDAVIDYAIFMLDAEGNIASWNMGASRVKGYEASEVLGKHFSIFYTPEDQAAGKPQKILDIVRRDGRYEEEGWRVRKDGTRFWANVVLTALKDAQGKPLGFAKVTRDLSSRREAEEKDRVLLREQTAREVAQQSEAHLRDSQERYRSLSKRLEIVLEGVADGITVQDLTGRVVFANSAAAKICGFQTGAELMGTPPEEVVARFELFDAEDRPFPPESLPARRALAGEGPSGTVLHVRPRGTHSDWWVSLRASAVLDSDGNPELAVNIWHDVTLAHRQEVQSHYLAEASTALTSSLVADEMLATLTRVLVPGMADRCAIYLLEGERLREVASSVAEPSRTEPEQGGARANPLAPAFSEASLRAVVGSAVSELHDAVLLAPIRANDRVLGAMALSYVQAGRRYDAGDLALIEELARRAAVAIERAQLYGSAQEARKAAELAASRAEAAARSAEEASRAKDEFLATVSHELRTPLNAILGWATLLRNRQLDPTTAKPIEVIRRNAHAQMKIIDDILDVSRVITGKFRLEAKPIDLVAVVRETIEVVQPSADAKNIDIELDGATEFCLLVADPERLQQVVWNLLSNAVKFTEPSGRIRIAVTQEGSRVLLSVTDTGKGIDPQFLPFVFDRFKQADSSTTRKVGGLGLGLALVRHIVELHGGHVAVESEGLGKGATFSITLPIRAVMPDPSPRPAAPKPQSEPPLAPTDAVLRGMRVLVVDDEPDALELVAAVLVDAGAEVDMATSAEEGLEALARSLPHVLVSDIGMPDQDGYSLIRRIRALPREKGGALPALALTAFAREEDRTKALSAGYTTHIGKPVNPEALVAAVRNLGGFSLRSS